MVDLRNVRALTDTDKREALDRIYAAWCKTPQLRLGQLLTGAVQTDLDAFYIEDWPLVEAVERLVDHG